jgi:CheY-like chemotaxis protein
MDSFPEPRPEHDPATTARPTVLVVDDYPENCRLLYFYLRGDFEVLTAASAEEAFEILDRQRVELVVMDINLKDGMNGIEAAARIRQRDDLGHLPILAISAYAYPDDRARFLEAGFDDYIPKPIFKERMLRKVRALLEGRDEGVWITAPRAN